TPKFKRRPCVVKEFRIDPEESCRVEALQALPAKNFGGVSEAVTAGDPVVLLAPQDEVLVIAVEPIQIQGFAGAFSCVAKGYFALPPDLDQALGNAGAIGYKDPEITIFVHLA